MSEPIPGYWTVEDIDRLTHMSIAEVAQQTGYPIEEVMRVRQLLNQRAALAEINQHRAIDWSEGHLALLGTLPDQEIAYLLGCSRQAVTAKRKALNIKPHTRIGLQWTNELILQLGRSSDRQMAEQMGVSLRTVLSKRQAQGIKAHRQPLAWTNDTLALLGTCSDGQLAQRLNCSRKTIIQKRKALGIPAHVPTTKSHS